MFNLTYITTALTTLSAAANARLVSLWLWPEIEFFVLSNRNATLIACEGEPLPPPPQHTSNSARQVKPVIWWKGLCVLKSPEDFVKFAVKLLSAPSSSGSIKRVFSNVGVILTKIRNRLGNETAINWCFVIAYCADRVCRQFLVSGIWI